MFSFAFEGRLLSANYYPVGARMNGHKYWPIIKEILLLIYISIGIWLKISFIQCILRIKDYAFRKSCFNLYLIQ